MENEKIGSLVVLNNHIIYSAKLIIEAETPLSIGSGREGFILDSLITKDANDLPYIPGTSLAGVLRHELKGLISNHSLNELFGYQNDGKNQNNEGKGSRICVSSAYLLAKDGKTVLDGLQNIDFSESNDEKEDENYYSFFRRLPQRDHVRINHRGVAIKGGKFEEQLIYKGTRFVFELELRGNVDDQKHWKELLDIIGSSHFRIGGGTRKGFGKISVHQCMARHFDLKKEKDLLSYLNKSSSLNFDTKGFELIDLENESQIWKKYSLKVKAENFFLFGLGFPDVDSDMPPKTERYFDWSTGVPKISEEQILIPASSIKGAISHRIAFHYNRLCKKYINDIGNENTPFSSFNFDEAYERFIANNDIETSDLSYNSDKWDELENIIKQSFTLENFKKESRSWEQWNDDLNREVEKNKRDIVPVGEGNKAIQVLFGFAKNESNKKKQEKDKDLSGARGNVIISDIFKPVFKNKVIDHVAIDRFTSGAMDAALYKEKVSSLDTELNWDILVHHSVFKHEDKNIIKAFEAALNDLVEGKLALGGNTLKGHGIFIGELIK